MLVDSCKLKEEPRLMGIGQGFFLVVFRFSKDRWRALLAGPTLINGHFMSIQLWSPRFNHLENTKKAFSPIWVRLENLPMEFYHRDVLVQIGNSLGTFLGLDADTHNLSKLKFACIYVLTNISSYICKFAHSSSPKKLTPSSEGSKQTADWVTVKPKKKKLPILAKSRFGKSIEGGKLQNLGKGISNSNAASNGLSSKGPSTSSQKAQITSQTQTQLKKVVDLSLINCSSSEPKSCLQIGGSKSGKVN
ncbi:hypothetical protein G2W53_033545 [Senna tora]|uniref:DUF4283 domain-containing protein n=1 Tax=Senna tora TaxID=362788 RepID=A0A834WCX7_9FABA|nr:hypothetical protein G2W53_033545 [Senna tora]